MLSKNFIFFRHIKVNGAPQDKDDSTKYNPLDSKKLDYVTQSENCFHISIARFVVLTHYQVLQNTYNCIPYTNYNFFLHNSDKAKKYINYIYKIVDDLAPTLHHTFSSLAKKKSKHLTRPVHHIPMFF